MHPRDENGRFGEGGSSDLPVDSDGNSYSRPAINLPKKEYGKVMHSINEVYDTKYKGEQTGVIRSANKSGYAKYFFEIHGYNEYNIYRKEKS